MDVCQSQLTLNILQHHPCFSDQAHERVGRVHLPVARRCNIRCAFCERRICANLTMQHPGWAQRYLSPYDAAGLVERLARSHPGEAFVVGVAGPGDPLANTETYQTLEMVYKKHPGMLICVSTNGLLLENAVPRLIEVGVSALTVTVNAPDTQIGGQIYEWVRHHGVIYRGQEAAEVLIDSQIKGIRAALEAGIVVKVNTVLIPGVNDRGMLRLANRLKELGVPLMNIMPLIPCGKMKDRRPPTCEELRKIRSDCEAAVAQFRSCEHCSADVIRFPRRAGL